MFKCTNIIPNGATLPIICFFALYLSKNCLVAAQNDSCRLNSYLALNFYEVCVLTSKENNRQNFDAHADDNMTFWPDLPLSYYLVQLGLIEEALSHNSDINC